jgi:hypothetical protein
MSTEQVEGPTRTASPTHRLRAANPEEALGFKDLGMGTINPDAVSTRPTGQETSACYHNKIRQHIWGHSPAEDISSLGKKTI